MHIEKNGSKDHFRVCSTHLWDSERFIRVVPGDCQYGVPGLRGPRVHDFLHGHVASENLVLLADGGQLSPQVILLSVGVWIFHQVAVAKVVNL